MVRTTAESTHRRLFNIDHSGAGVKPMRDTRQQGHFMACGPFCIKSTILPMTARPKQLIYAAILIKGKRD